MDDNEMWDWQGQSDYLEDGSNADISKCLLNGGNGDENLSYIYDDGTTPVKDISYPPMNNEVKGKGKGKELEIYKEPESQVKRRRTLQFDAELSSAQALYCDEAFLRSKETVDSLEDAIADMSEWVNGFTEDVPGSSNECLDPSAEGWIAECFNDSENSEMHFSTGDMSSNVPDESDVQIDITDLCDTYPEYGGANAVVKQPVQTRQKVVFKGRKSYMRSPPKIASSVVYPFAIIKPCGAHGDVTLKDINEKIHNPPKPKQNEEDLSVAYPTSAFSGKPVVGKTKIHTEGGKGSITIMRTKG